MQDTKSLKALKWLVAHVNPTPIILTGVSRLSRSLKRTGISWLEKFLQMYYKSYAEKNRYVKSGIENHEDLLDFESITTVANYSVFSFLSGHRKEWPPADFVKVKELHNGFLLVAGDIVGHGLTVCPGAAIALTVFQATSSTRPDVILKEINRALFPLRKENGGEAYVMVLRFYNNGCVKYAGAMDTQGIHSGTWKKIPGEYLVCGQLPEIEPEVKTARMKPRDILVVASDGARWGDDDRMSAVITMLDNRMR